MAKEETIKELFPGVSATTYEECAYREGKLFSEMVERVNRGEDTSGLTLTSQNGPVKMYFLALRDFYAGTTGSPPFGRRTKNFCEEGCKHSSCEYHPK